MAYWKLRPGDEFLLNGSSWKVVQRRDTMMQARRDDGSEVRKNFYLYRVFRDAEFVAPGPEPARPRGWYLGSGVSARIIQVPRNLDRPKAVSRDDLTMHVWLELVREKDFRLPDGTRSRKHVNLYFSLPAGSDLPTVDEALDAVVADSIGFEDAPGFNTWMRTRRRPQWIREEPPGLEAWAADNGYALNSPETELAYNFVRKRSRKLRALGSQDLYHDCLWKRGRLQDNRWGALLTVTGQVPPR